MQDWLALPGVPAGSAVFEKIPVRTHQFFGLETSSDRVSWHLDSFVEEVLPHYSEETILLGQDLGGLIAAMAVLKKPPKALVLTGTSVNAWWSLTRWSALPILHHFFYGSFQGRLFYALGQGAKIKKKLPLDANIRAKRMRILAQNIKPPSTLIQLLQNRCPIFMIWGTQDIVYPIHMGYWMAKRLNSPLFCIRGGHYCMWNQSLEFANHMNRIDDIVG